LKLEAVFLTAGARGRQYDSPHQRRRGSRGKDASMYVVRDVFKARPGKAKELVAKFRKALPEMHSPGAKNVRLMTDTVAGYWTVVIETEVEEVQHYFDSMRTQPSAAAQEAMAGYMDLVYGGHREIFKVE
jgi:ABC-type nitrate/sulfonate/bicarbonate transport system substrate-binding protein